MPESNVIITPLIHDWPLYSERALSANEKWLLFHCGRPAEKALKDVQKGLIRGEDVRRISNYSKVSPIPIAETCIVGNTFFQGAVYSK
jgi:hypothetical protein